MASSVEDEFSVSDEEFALDDEDDFDLGAAAALDTNTSLQDLDAELANESFGGPLSLEDESDVDLDDLDLELDEQSFAEIEKGLEADQSPAESALSVEDDSHLEETIELTLSETLRDVPIETEELDAVADAEVEAFDESAPLLNTAEEELADDDIFEQAMSDFSAESLALDEEVNMSDDDMDAELDFMADADEASTKLDLARAYMDMGDNEGARDILAEVAHEGNEQQRQEAVDLLSRIDA